MLKVQQWGHHFALYVANIYMEHFETIDSYETWILYTPQAFGRDSVDDTFVILDPAMQRRVLPAFEWYWRVDSIDSWEHQLADGSLPFPDTLVTVEEDGSPCQMFIYKKPSHTNQYLQWDSHHSIANKYSVINSLLHRANNICSNQEQKKEELTYVAGSINNMQISFLGHTKSEAEEEHSKTK